MCNIFERVGSWELGEGGYDKKRKGDKEKKEENRRFYYTCVHRKSIQIIKYNVKIYSIYVKKQGNIYYYFEIQRNKPNFAMLIYK